MQNRMWDFMADWMVTGEGSKEPFKAGELRFVVAFGRDLVFNKERRLYEFIPLSKDRVGRFGEEVKGQRTYFYGSMIVQTVIGGRIIHADAYRISKYVLKLGNEELNGWSLITNANSSLLPVGRVLKFGEKSFNVYAKDVFVMRALKEAFGLITEEVEYEASEKPWPVFSKDNPMLPLPTLRVKDGVGRTRIELPEDQAETIQDV